MHTLIKYSQPYVVFFVFEIVNFLIGSLFYILHERLRKLTHQLNPLSFLLNNQVWANFSKRLTKRKELDVERDIQIFEGGEVCVGVRFLDAATPVARIILQGVCSCEWLAKQRSLKISDYFTFHQDCKCF
jgi:hypothetical protein